jgi:sodium transport system ATP-binding protein
MIEVRNLHKRFGAIEAVGGLSFSAPNGQITGILGENGAGKTTTLAMMCGLVQPDQGSIEVGLGDSVGRERRRRIGALLDHKGLYDRLSARENIAYFGALHGMHPRVLHARVEEVLALLGLEAVADRRTAGFSQGERMKVALGRAIVHAPPHLLLDEPTNGLDIPSVHGLREILRHMRSRGTCIIFSSHVLDEVRALCDSIVIIAHGQLVASGTIAEICQRANSETLERAFLTLTGRARQAVAS